MSILAQTTDTRITLSSRVCVAAFCVLLVALAGGLLRVHQRNVNAWETGAVRNVHITSVSSLGERGRNSWDRLVHFRLAQPVPHLETDMFSRIVSLPETTSISRGETVEVRMHVEDGRTHFAFFRPRPGKRIVAFALILTALGFAWHTNRLNRRYGTRPEFWPDED